MAWRARWFLSSRSWWSGGLDTQEVSATSKPDSHLIFDEDHWWEDCFRQPHCDRHIFQVLSADYLWKSDDSFEQDIERLARLQRAQAPKLKSFDSSGGFSTELWEAVRALD